MFVSTRASDHVMALLQEYSCLTITAPTGAGKSFIAKHTALVLKKEGYTIIPVYSPTDIRDYYQPGKQTVFIVDDICGNFTANQLQIENWKQLLPVIKTVIADKCCKIIVCCRLQIYKDDKFDILLPFKSCECNLISDKLCLTSVEKTNIAKTYFGRSMTDIDDLSSKWEFFPLLCSLYHEKEYVDVKEYFKNPFDVYKSELDRLSEYGDEGNYKICSLALCVIFNNQLEEEWLHGRTTDQQRYVIEDTCIACDINRSTSKVKLKKALDTLDGTFICKENGTYSTVHKTLFDFLAHYFGQKMMECLIDHGDSCLVHERFIWQKTPDDMTSNIDFIIEIPDDYLNSYLQRFIKDWSAGMVSYVFSNNNMKVSSFRQKLIQYLLQLDKPQQVALASTKDTVVPKESCASGTTPLVLTCHLGYTDMVRWLLRNDVHVDQCRGDGVSGLIMAKGHTEGVKLLLERNPDVNLCNKNGCTPLIQASENNHTDIVKLLLEWKPDPCDITLLSTSYVNNNTSISNSPNLVQPLMKYNLDINAQTYDGGNALYFSALNGNIEITQLLLVNNADINICIHSKQCITDTLHNHPSRNLEEEKQGLFDSLVKSTSTRVTEYVSKKSVDYAFDVVAGSSPLHIACFMGRRDLVRCLLHYNADINITKEDGTTPLFYACEVGHEDIICLLLDKGANTYVCRVGGKSPLQIATDNGYTTIVEIVTEHMKKKANLPS